MEQESQNKAEELYICKIALRGVTVTGNADGAVAELLRAVDDYLNIRSALSRPGSGTVTSSDLIDAKRQLDYARARFTLTGDG